MLDHRRCFFKENLFPSQELSVLLPPFYDLPCLVDFFKFHYGTCPFLSKAINNLQMLMPFFQFLSKNVKKCQKIPKNGLHKALIPPFYSISGRQIYCGNYVFCLTRAFRFSR